MMELFFCHHPLTISPVIDFVASLVEEPLTTIPSHIFPLTQISEPKNKIRKVNSCQITTSTQGRWPVGILEFLTISVAKIQLKE